MQGVVHIGSADTNEIVLADRKISRVHVEVDVLPTGLRVRDLGSKSGTFFQGSRVGTMELPSSGAVLTLGASEIALPPDDAATPLGSSPRERCGRLLGASVVMSPSRRG
jgi:pSer/pThr/pTyr-binding forkhead associated (FHA) protein